MLRTLGFQTVWGVVSFILTPPLAEILSVPSTIPLGFAAMVMLFVIFHVNAILGIFKIGILLALLLIAIDYMRWTAGQWNGFTLLYALIAMPISLIPKANYLFVHIGLWLYLAFSQPSVYYSRRKIVLCIAIPIAAYFLLAALVSVIFFYISDRFWIPLSWASLAICPAAIFGGILIACKENFHLLRAPLLKRKPLIERRQLDEKGAPNCFSIAHLSDIHLTGGEDTAEGQKSPDDKFAAICCHRELLEADLVIATGDITDTGHPREWKIFFDCVRPEIFGKLILVPGNHDVAVVDRGLTRVEDVDAFSRTQRLVRMIAAIEKVQGSRATIIDHNKKACRLSAFLAPYVERMNEFMQSPPALRRSAWDSELDMAPQTVEECLASAKTDFVIHGIWHTIFPMAVESSISKVFVVVLNSNNLSYSMFNNAFGSAGSKIDGFDRLYQLQNRLRNAHLVYAVHHHLIQPPQVQTLPCRQRFQSRFMVMADSAYLYQAIAREPGRSTVVFHGHHHIHYIARLDARVDLVGAPSSGFGDAVPNSVGPGFYLYYAGRHPNGVSLKAAHHVAV